MVHDHINEQNSGRKHLLIGQIILKNYVPSFITFKYSCDLLLNLHLLFRCRIFEQSEQRLTWLQNKIATQEFLKEEASIQLKFVEIWTRLESTWKQKSRELW